MGYKYINVLTSSKVSCNSCILFLISYKIALPQQLTSTQELLRKISPYYLQNESIPVFEEEEQPPLDCSTTEP